MEQAVHSSSVGPVQVLQLAWHGWQTSAAAALPPAHEKPASMLEQSELQPSPVSVLPSSQISEPTRKPSAQIETQASLLSIEPPEHVKPGSIAQLALQPSPFIVLLSSQLSAVNQRMRIPTSSENRKTAVR